MHRKILTGLALACAVQSVPALARNIVISNDDGLTSNVKALYEALRAAGHDVIVSVPCQNQSGMGAAIRFMRPLTPLAQPCLNDAARAGEPGVGAMTRPGFTSDFFYVDGTPVMATLYGIDIAAAKRWGRAPDLVLSGPNEGQNIGSIVVTSGTVSNVQYAADRGIPAIALSAGHNTVGDMRLANPNSAKVAALAVDMVRALDVRSRGEALLPRGVSLNVNFPDELAGANWRSSRIGTYNALRVEFVEDMGATDAGRARGFGGQHVPGLVVGSNANAPRPDQSGDESIVNRKDISVSVMQTGYDHDRAARQGIEERLSGLLSR
ncbi:5'/3'-nucleotidase SurE [Novosphingobium sp. JCM 18896]|uniref:5'/3'-nucleotidase SurE n=1 Tax=Novosphingobium sp. JCM 18896 TaxID=2989731 RepID=UPI002222B46D|nr:5'/3'-nucleotidase SurE [Novosphingobium sp. JCM 18896]MCW1432425.1 5'/3'-nucleotidase SurE [Novosphingobium sp. JCM 18896]